MQRSRVNQCLFTIVCGLVLSLISLGGVQAEEGRWTAGFNTGLTLLTQEATAASDSSLGPVLNFQVSYGLNSIVSAGFFFEWESRSFDQESPDIDLGTLHTISLMPMAIWNLGTYKSVFPYLSTAIGVNVNTFSEDSNVPDFDFDNTFAWRLAGGVNYPLEMITKNLMLNGEVAWKRNRGGIEQGNVEGNFDASSISLLVGVRYTF